MAKIDVFCPITRNSSAYAEYLRKTGEALKSDKHVISWKAAESVNAERMPERFENIGKAGEFGQNSLNHAMALHKSMEHISSPYVIFIDVDVVISQKNWDDIVVQKLSTEGFDCFGFAWGNDEVRRYHRFPNVLFFAFKRDLLKKVDLDFRPALSKHNNEKVRKHMLTKEEASYMRRRPRSIVKCDTGWLLPVTLGRAKCTGCHIPMVRSSSKARKLPFRNKKQRNIFKLRPTHMTEYHYEGELFGSHLQASRNIPFDSKYARVWRQRVHDYILKRYDFELEPGI